MAIQKIEHVGIQCRDIETSIAFYRDVIGMDLKGTLDHTNGVIKLAFLGFPGKDETELELIYGYNSDLPTEGKVHHIAFTVDKLEPEVDRLKSLGVNAIDAEITTLPNGSRYFFFNGPDGEWIELFESTR
ncbi:VOC family protein [Tumebacillus sp. ITR2]|jgi:lactoylglutathione lyase|uniref:VOC family protein n=1 Tax=Tumebacillus amylolyticus TaxID=2801339 RepID=A0ABS1JAH4_9BACL|nr:VOC family protein [Tumebacillus amylolyticus]MBL0387254.1 VOC family protein [Tumebacillus amylolyticus]